MLRPDGEAVSSHASSIDRRRGGYSSRERWRWVPQGSLWSGIQGSAFADLFLIFGALERRGGDGLGDLPGHPLHHLVDGLSPLSDESAVDRPCTHVGQPDHAEEDWDPQKERSQGRSQREAGTEPYAPTQPAQSASEESSGGLM